jgi:hypothetical protein
MTTTVPVQPSQELNQELAAKLADACVNPSYMPDLWAVYFRRFQEVLSEETLFECRQNRDERADDGHHVSRAREETRELLRIGA